MEFALPRGFVDREIWLKRRMLARDLLRYQPWQKRDVYFNEKNEKHKNLLIEAFLNGCFVVSSILKGYGPFDDNKMKEHIDAFKNCDFAFTSLRFPLEDIPLRLIFWDYDGFYMLCRVYIPSLQSELIHSILQRNQKEQ